MGRTHRTIALLAVILGCGCLPIPVVGGDLALDLILPEHDATGPLPIAYQAGDTASFVAGERENGEYASGAAAPSSTNPGAYTWTSTDTAVAEVISPGRVRMLKSGVGGLLVTGPHASTTVRLDVIPKVGAILVAPAGDTIEVGQSATFTLTPVDPSGAPINLNSLPPLSLREITAAPFPSVMIVNSAGTTWSVSGKKVGNMLLVPSIPKLFRGNRLADTVIVLVK